MLKTKRLTLIVMLCALSAIISCNDASDDSDDLNNPSETPGDSTRRYSCPNISTSTIRGEVPAAHSFDFNMLIPDSFKWAEQQSAEHGDTFQIVRFELPFTTPTDKNYPARRAVIEVEQGPLVRSNAALPLPKETIPYVMGSGGEDEAAAEAQAAGKGLKAGDMEIGGASAMILRRPGKDVVKFTVRAEMGEMVRDLTVSMYAAKLYPVFTSDAQGAACIADFDRIALDVTKSLAASWRHLSGYAPNNTSCML